MFQQAVDAGLFLLIKKISSVKAIAGNFYLAGGTALSLHYGHRKSVDLDLFSQQEFDLDETANELIRLGCTINKTSRQTIHGICDGSHLSLFNYPYVLLSPSEKISDDIIIPMASVPDIAAMKVTAISHRAEKKDFFDLYEICKHHTMEEIRDWCFKKFDYEKTNSYHLIRSILYFDDAEKSINPKSLNGTTWTMVKQYFADNEKEFTTIWLK
jgi:predicted nucleotidyltransferase component of viral defense system